MRANLPLLDIHPTRAVNNSARTASYSNDCTDVLKKSVVMKPGFAKLDAVPSYNESLRSSRRRRKNERDKTAGPKWFGLEAGSLEENINDLEIIRMRSGLGSLLGKQRYYRAADRRTLPKFFQTGVVVETPADFYSGRVPKRQRKKTLVEELLADADIKRTQQSKYSVIATREATKRRAAASRRMKKLKKKRR